MTNYEILSTVLALISLVIAVIALAMSASASSAANAIAKENLSLVHGQLEIELRNQITDSRRYVEDFFKEHMDFLAKSVSALTEDEKKKRERLKTSANSAIEGYLSALDGACQKYIDSKIDKVRFKKAYQREIRQAVQDEGHKEFFPPGHAHNALMRVYEEWENPERL